MNYWDILLAEKLKKDPPLPPIPDNAYLLEQATGDVITLTDAAALPMPTATTTLTPIQDLHGFSYPWVGGAGKNLLPMTVEGIKSANTSGTWSGNTYTILSCDFTVLTDNSNNVTGIKINNAPSGNHANFYLSNEITLNENCTLSGGVGTATVKLRVYSGQTVAAEDAGQGASITAGTYTNTRIIVNENYNPNNMIIYPMIRLATVTDPTFAPYSNICPISGYDGAEYTRTGVNVWDEQWEVGGYYNVNGVWIEQIDILSSKNFISVIPNTNYYVKSPENIGLAITFWTKDQTFIERRSGQQNSIVTTPSNCFYIAFNMAYTYGTTYNNDISINYPSTITTYAPYQAQSVTLTFDNTIYSGVIDWCAGVVTVDKAMVDLGDMSWNYRTQAPQFYVIYDTITNAPKIPPANVKANAICSNYKVVARDDSTNFTFCIATNGNFFVYNDNYTDASTFKTAMDGAQLLYELSTPITYQLTATQLTTLAGYNTIYTDIGNISLEYWTKEVRA